MAQKTTDPILVVQAQLDAYNQQDVKAYGSVFAEDVLVYSNLGDSTPSLKGRAAVEKRYSDLFKRYPNNKSTLIGRMQQGNCVIDHELITGRETEIRLIAIYEVKDGQISRCWFIR